MLMYFVKGLCYVLYYILLYTIRYIKSICNVHKDIHNFVFILYPFVYIKPFFTYFFT